MQYAQTSINYVIKKIMAPRTNVSGVTFVYENINHNAIAITNSVIIVIILSLCMLCQGEITIFEGVCF